MSIRTVAIVGRPNVGKSALFNRLARRRISIVHDQPGVTRDRITVECNLGRAPFTVIDTGGIGSDVDTSFTEQVESEVALAIEASELILFVVDGHSGLTPVDEVLATKLRKSKRPVILVVNKVDHENHDAFESDFAQLGFAEMLSISAEHNRGIGDLVDAVEDHLTLPVAREEGEEAPSVPLELAIVGRPNVGKSSLINAILQDSRTLVSPISGTTRDAVDIPYERMGNRYILIDTAGIRPKGKQESSIEVFSVMRSERTIRRADLCVLVVDATMGVTAQDKKIAGLIQEARKPCVVVVNKWDLVKESPDFSTRKEELAAMLDKVRAELFFVDYAPIIVLSAMKVEGLTRLFKLIEQVHRASKVRIGTGVLNRLIAEAMTAHPPPARSGKRLKVIYATQPSEDDGGRPEAIPTPTIHFFVNQQNLLIDSYRKYLETQIRKEAPWLGLPLHFTFREREARGRRAHTRK